MSAVLYYPMAPAHSVPAIYRRYHPQHLPPPSDPTEFMSSLRRGLRGAHEVGLWGKLKGAGWRFLLRFDNGRFTPSEIPLRPDFPVAPPESPSAPNTPLPDFCITPASSSGFDISPLLPQEEGFLAVPVRSSRGRRMEVVSPRKLPTPPGAPPSYSVQDAERHRRAIVTSYSSADEPLATPDLTANDIVTALLYAESVLTPDDESPSYDSPQELGSDMVSDTSSSSGSPSEPRDSPFAISDTLVEEIRDTTADTEFLEELGLSAEDYRQLLGVVNFVLDEKDED